MKRRTTALPLAKLPRVYRELIYGCACASVRCASSSLLPPRGGSPFADPPGEFLFFLYHPFRRHFCFCAGSEGSRRIWRAALRDGIRYRSTGEAAEAGGRRLTKQRGPRARALCPRDLFTERGSASRVSPRLMPGGREPLAASGQFLAAAFLQFRVVWWESLRAASI